MKKGSLVESLEIPSKLWKKKENNFFGFAGRSMASQEQSGMD